jgi:hypothetical protein
MLNNKQIDRLCYEKLKDYQKEPPVFLWNNIEKQINRNKGDGNLIFIIAVAAAVFTLFLSGWWLTGNDHSIQPVSLSSASKGNDPKQADKITDPAVKFKPSAFAMASFAAKSSLPAKNNKKISEGEEPVFVSPHDKITGPVINRICSDEKSVKKVTEPVSSRNLAYRENEEKNLTTSFKPERKDHKWDLKIQSGLLVTSGIKNITGLRTSSENSFSRGITGGYQLTRRLSVKSGLMMNQLKQRSQTSDLISSVINTPLGKVNINPSGSFSKPVIKQKLDYLGIPVRADYKIIDKKVNVSVNAGINANLLTSNKAVISDNHLTTKSKTAEMRDVTWSGEVGVEIGYDISKKITFSVEPHLKQFINSLNSSADLRPFQAELIAGLTYSFN